MTWQNTELERKKLICSAITVADDRMFEPFCLEYEIVNNNNNCPRAKLFLIFFPISTIIGLIPALQYNR